MKREIKFRWVEALRSGKYRQGRNYLHDREGNFCCLGVLCDLAVQEGVISKPYLNVHPGNVQSPKIWHSAAEIGHFVFYYGEEGKSHSGVLPTLIMAWAGLDEDDPRINNTRLSVFNDRGHSFEEIALLIEKHIPEED